ncbi:MAG TPA: DUF975 family protein [Candidatus Levybacteria bacterium]|nr:DUF975 family protein [Candidatus Levybacteria bacterium]
MVHKSFSVKEAFSFGWNTVLKNPVIVLYTLGVYGLSFVVSQILNTIFRVDAQETNFIISFLSTFITSFFWVGYLQVLFRLVEGKKIEINQLISRDYKLVFFYALGTYIYVIGVLLGLVLLIVPGIIVGVALSMWMYVLLTHKDMHVIDAFKKSWEITKGHRMQLFLMALAALGVVLVGTLAILVGLLVAIPVIYLAFIHVYKKLSGSK